MSFDPRLLLPNQGPQQAPLQIASPINDIQLVALLATQLYMTTDGRPSESALRVTASVDLAIDIIAESMKQLKDGSFDRALQAKLNPQ